MNFRPIGKWLSVKFRPPQTKTKSGLHLPRPVYSQVATIIAVGEQVEHLKAGDLVLMHKHGDAMVTQKSLWYHYFDHMLDGKKADDFEVMPVVVTDDDVFGFWDDKKGLIPHKNNVIFIEYTIPEKVNGIIRVLHHRQNRKPFGKIASVSKKVKAFKKGQTVLLGRYGGAYFTDIDGKEKVLVSTKEILATVEGANKDSNITVSQPLEIHDTQISS